ncbi:porin [Leisingera daeponensis]|uniref:porin n=1 Tax=Leisingera daeponensis TaxID=405746 RepID=UPI001C95BBB7|nr:porin [Leisingera daeponensis]MBY6056721.1 porin [Leisingera daeponensis]
MTIRTSTAIALSTSALLCTGPALAEGFSWEGEIEIGNDSVLSSDDPNEEIRDTFASISASGTYTFGNDVEIFASITTESLTDPTEDRTFDDMGVYIEELGVAFEIGDATTVAIGKLSPVFGTAGDDAAGYFGDSLADDYELTEQIGILSDVELNGAGTLSFGVFYADDSALSRSIGFDRGRATTADGGAGNTGKLNNFVVQWTQETGSTTFHVGARHLSAGQGDVDDEQGMVAGLAHSLDNGFDLYGEVASFSNAGGSADDAVYATLTGAYTIGSLTLSGGLAHRDFDASGDTDLITIGADYEFESGASIGGGLARVDEAGVKSTVLGMSLIIPLGG